MAGANNFCSPALGLHHTLRRWSHPVPGGAARRRCGTLGGVGDDVLTELATLLSARNDLDSRIGALMGDR